MPLISVKTVGAKTAEQKRKLAKDITEVVVKDFKVPPEAVTIDIIEYSSENFAQAGKLFVDR